MGLFGFIKNTLMGDWMEPSYIEAGLEGAIAGYLEEAVNAAITTSLAKGGKVTPGTTAYRLVKHGIRFLFSGLYYYIFRRLGKNLTAVVASMFPVLLSISDFIRFVVGKSAEELGMSLAGWKSLAYASAGGQTIVVRPTTTPAPKSKGVAPSGAGLEIIS